ncbi:hypothetical protein DY000_02020952 [Brassica cretica]|uniref:Retrotransposon gag domain-containing protein n=1 Tax=Brassica cretica TaxID=69181 RepID=A0ABQ7EJD0_BRACR|nr:hypothetical protein DY000_02020952 [Brassica cretica]
MWGVCQRFACLASHTSLSDSSVTHPSFLPLSEIIVLLFVLDVAKEKSYFYPDCQSHSKDGDGHVPPPVLPQAGQQVPPVQVQGNQQPPIQQVPGVFQVPPPPVLPEQVSKVDETLIRVMGQMKSVDLETFGGTVDLEVAYNWKHMLVTCLETIHCPIRLCLNIAYVFDKKYFPREVLHQKKNAFEHLSHGTRSVREYEREFCQICMFAGNNFDEGGLDQEGAVDSLELELAEPAAPAELQPSA